MDQGSPSVESQWTVAPAICFVLAIAEMPVAWNHLENTASPCLVSLSLPLSLWLQLVTKWQIYLGSSSYFLLQQCQRPSVPWPSEVHSGGILCELLFHSLRDFIGTELTPLTRFEGRKDIVGRQFCIRWTFHQGRCCETWEAILKPCV